MERKRLTEYQRYVYGATSTGLNARHRDMDPVQLFDEFGGIGKRLGINKGLVVDWSEITQETPVVDVNTTQELDLMNLVENHQHPSLVGFRLWQEFQKVQGYPAKVKWKDELDDERKQLLQEGSRVRRMLDSAMEHVYNIRELSRLQVDEVEGVEYYSGEAIKRRRALIPLYLGVAGAYQSMFGEEGVGIEVELERWNLFSDFVQANWGDVSYAMSRDNVKAKYGMLFLWNVVAGEEIAEAGGQVAQSAV